MAKRGIKEWIMRSVILVVGLIIAHFGVTLFLLSNLGADPFNVFVQGLFRILSSVIPASLITHGRTHMAVCLLIIFILLFVDRSYIKIGTVICMVCGGPIIDFFTWLLGLILGSEQPLWSRILMLVLGCVILAYGMTIVIKSDAGTGPNDLVAVVISDKTKKKFGIIRLIVDGVFAAIGFALGGVLGAGTIVCIALVGPVAGVFLPLNERIIERMLKKMLKKQYKFYGWQNADCKPADSVYEKIENPRKLYDTLSEIWCAETCAPRMRERWTRENKTLGQCSITAFLVQDIFGGKVYGIPCEGGKNFHCYNVVPLSDGSECVFDLTSEQFGDEKLCYENNPEQFREVHFKKEEKFQRYKFLKAELLNLCQTF